MNATRFALKPIEQPSYRFRDVPPANRDLSGSTLTCLTDREAWQSCMAEMLLVCKEAIRRRRHGRKSHAPPAPPVAAAAAAAAASSKEEDKAEKTTTNGGAASTSSAVGFVKSTTTSSSSSEATASGCDEEEDSKPKAVQEEDKQEETEEKPPKKKRGRPPKIAKEPKFPKRDKEEQSSKGGAATATATSTTPHASKPLSLEYIADRLDVDDPVWGYVVRSDDDQKMLQGFITVTTFTNYQRTFRWDSNHERSFKSEEDEEHEHEHHHGHGHDGDDHKHNDHKHHDPYDMRNRKVDRDGSLARQMQASVRAGDIWNEGIVWPRIAEIGLLGGLACGRTLVKLVLEQLECARKSPRANYDFVVLQATDNSIPFYESLGFVRVGAIQQRENINDEGQAQRSQPAAAGTSSSSNSNSDDDAVMAEPVASDDSQEAAATSVAALPTRPISSKVKQYTTTKAGETPTTIAKKMEVDVYDILFLNNHLYPELSVGSKMRLGSLLLLPDEVVAPPPQPSPSSQTDSGKKKQKQPMWYIAKENETPRSIARKLGLHCMQLVNANKTRLEGLLSSSRLKNGTKIKISNLDNPDEQYKPYSHWTFPDDKFEEGEPSYMMALQLDRSKRGKKHPRPLANSLAISVPPDYDPTAKRDAASISFNDVTTPEQKAAAIRVAAAGRAHRRRWQSHQDLEQHSSSSSSGSSSTPSHTNSTTTTNPGGEDSSTEEEEEDEAPPNPPQKPPANVYRLYVADFRRANPELVAGKHVGEVSIIAGEGFRGLKPNEKQALDMRFFDMNVEYNAAMDEYKRQIEAIRSRKERKRLRKLGLVDPPSQTLAAAASSVPPPPPPPTYQMIDLFNKVVKLKPGSSMAEGSHYDYWYVLTYIPDLQWCHLAPMVQVGHFGDDKPNSKGRPKWKLVDEDLGEEVDISSSLCIPVKAKSMRRTLDADKEEWDIIGTPLPMTTPAFSRSNSLASGYHSHTASQTQSVSRRESMTSFDDSSLPPTATTSRKRKRSSLGGGSVASVSSALSNSNPPIVAIMSGKRVKVCIKVGTRGPGRPKGSKNKPKNAAPVPSQVTAPGTTTRKPAPPSSSSSYSNKKPKAAPKAAPVHSQVTAATGKTKVAPPSSSKNDSSKKGSGTPTRRSSTSRVKVVAPSESARVEAVSSKAVGQTKTASSKRSPSQRSQPTKESVDDSTESGASATADGSNSDDARAVSEPLPVYPVGSVVVVQARMWPGHNKEGGVGRVTRVQQDGSVLYDVKYILGGREKNIEAVYVSLQAQHLAGPASSGEARVKEIEHSTPSKRSSSRFQTSASAESSSLRQPGSNKKQPSPRVSARKSTRSSTKDKPAASSNEEMIASGGENNSHSETSVRLATKRFSSPALLHETRGRNTPRTKPDRTRTRSSSAAVSSSILTEVAPPYPNKRPRREGAFMSSSRQHVRDPLELLMP